MASEWQDKHWGELATLEYGKGLSGYETSGGTYPVYGTNGQIGFHTEPLYHGPGVIIGRKGAYRGVHYSKRPFFVIDTAFFLKPKVELDPRWAYYQLLTQSINNMDSGSAIPSTSRPDFYALSVRFPPPTEQRAIAHILGTLDDKIDLNRRINETLEGIARALFKSWFVDFEPVRAKAEGRDTGLPPHLADLFPARLVDTVLGDVPEGWKVGRLDDAFVLQRGFDLPATQRTIGPYPVIAAGGLNGTHSQFMARGPGVITGRSGVLGNVFFVHDNFWPLNTTLWVREFRNSRPAFAFYLLQRQDFKAFNAGSAVPTLNRNHVHSIPTLLPPMAVIDAFETMVIALFRRKRANDDASRVIAALRDALLPKLITGEIRTGRSA